jgi:hypothetical protein
MEIPIMAHYAELNENNIVLQVLVVRDQDTLDESGNESEDIGRMYLNNLLGGRWIKTSYNTFGNQHSNNGTPLRGNYAGIGYTYDPFRDVFIPPKPEDPNNPNRYVLDEKTFFWTDTLQKNISIEVTRL